jgi:hypothetical protein
MRLLPKDPSRLRIIGAISMTTSSAKPHISLYILIPLNGTHDKASRATMLAYRSTKDYQSVAQQYDAIARKPCARQTFITRFRLPHDDPISCGEAPRNSPSSAGKWEDIGMPISPGTKRKPSHNLVIRFISLDSLRILWFLSSAPVEVMPLDVTTPES